MKTAQDKINRLYILRIQLERKFSLELLKQYGSKRFSDARYSYKFQAKYPRHLKKLHSQIMRLQKLHNALWEIERIYK